MAVQHSDFRRAFKVAAVRVGIRSACENAAGEMFACVFNELSTHLRTERIAHDEQIAAFKAYVFAHGHVEIIVRNEKISCVEQFIDSAYAAFGENAFDTGFAECPEQLAGSVGAGYTGAPAVHFAGENARTGNFKQAQRRCFAVRRIEYHIIFNYFYVVAFRAEREIAGKCAGTADDGKIGFWYIHGENSFV